MAVFDVSHNISKLLMIGMAHPSIQTKKHLPRWSFLVAGLALLPLAAQIYAADFELLVTRSPDPVVVNRELTFSIDVTNRTGFTVTNIVVTNLYPASARLTYISNFFTADAVFTNAGLLVLGIDFLTNNGRAQVEFSIAPTVLGDLTNTTIVSAFPLTNTTTTNVTTRVVSAIADLAAGISGPPPGALVNDRITYTISATNFGPDAVPNVMLTNTLPGDLILLSPTNTLVPFTNNNLVFTLGTLPAGFSIGFRVRVQPTNAANMTLLNQIGAAGAFDLNTTNDIVTNTFSVGSFLSGQLTASISSTQRYEPQSGLLEQLVTLSNTGATDAVSARVIVQGLTNLLFNALGTNAVDATNPSPFVLYATNLAAGASVDLLLEYFVTNRTAVSNPTLLAVEVPAFSQPVPSGTPVHVSRLVMSKLGRVLIEFPSETNHTYTVLYCDDATFSNKTRVALPTFNTDADRLQWIDYGPPKTLSHPSNTPSRFYRVIADP